MFYIFNPAFAGFDFVIRLFQYAGLLLPEINTYYVKVNCQSHKIQLILTNINQLINSC